MPDAPSQPGPSAPIEPSPWVTRATRFCRFGFLLGALAVLSLSLRRGDHLLDKPLTEDGYYMLTAARQLALGHGLSVDGVQLTNGVQPLFTFLAALAYLPSGGDRIAALHLVLLLHSLCCIGAAWLLGRLLRELFADAAGTMAALLQWLTALSYLASGYLFVSHHNGLETGCMLLLYLACWRLHQRWPLHGNLRAAGHGALLGLLVLARIDASFLVVAICGLHVLRAGEVPRGRRLLESAIVGLVALLVSSPWWIYNQIEFGSVMPSSGAAQMGMGGNGSLAAVLPARLWQAARALLLVATPHCYTGDGAGSNAVVALRLPLLAIVLALAWRSLRARLAMRNGTADGGVMFARALLLTGLGLAVWYPVRFWASHFYGRYFAPLSLLGSALFALAAFAAMQRWPFTRRLLPGALLAGALGLVVVAHTGVLFAGNEWYRDQLQLVEAHVPAGETVAGGQTGTIGYFLDHVHNLDGKVNAEALRHQDNMLVYLDQQRIDWLCDFHDYVSRYVPPERLRADWQLVDQRGRFELWHRHR